MAPSFAGTSGVCLLGYRSRLVPRFLVPFGGARDRAEVSIGTGVLFSHQGALVELYCLCPYWFCGCWPCLWKDGLGGRKGKLLNPPGAFLCIALINWHDLVTLIA